MNQVDLYSGGGCFGTSNGPLAIFTLIPKEIINPKTGLPYDAVAPVIITEYLLYQQASGTAICFMFFDRTDVPGNGTAPSDAAGFKFAVKTGTAPESVNLVNVIHRYDKGCVIIASTSSTQVTAAAEKVLFAVQYHAYRSG